MAEYEATDTGIQRIIRRGELQTVTGLHIDHLYREIRAGRFPKPVPLGARAVGWLETEIAAWVRERIAARDTAA